MLLNFAAALYLAGTIFLVIFVSGFGVLLLIYLAKRQDLPIAPPVDDASLLSVTVQLPIYNEPHVVDRLLDACAQLDYPPDKLHIQVLDDSTDCTTSLIDQKIIQLQTHTLCNISHIHRGDRIGYKAGALANGLQTVNTDCVAIFDADFVPEPDFLRRTMPYFNASSRLALIQTRWDHLNVDYNLLTRAQALSIDAHFGVEQVARNRGHLPMSMNGTGGLWRVAAIEDAGGWSSSTLTEDLDLSYRAYMRSWDFLYLVDVAVPGELTPLIQSYKTQQARWAIGSTQCLVKHSRQLLTNRHFSLLKKLMGMMHLAQYIAQPVILLLFLLTPILVWADVLYKLPDLTFIALVGIIPPLVIALGQIELYEDWRHRLLYFPVQFMAAVAIILSNSRAVLSALHHPDNEYEFQRTPKFRLSRRKQIIQGYDLQIDFTTVGELCLAIYALFGSGMAFEHAPGLIPYMLVYAGSFAGFAFWNIYQTWRLSHFQPI